MNTNLLFVYGSLLDSNNEFGHYLMHNGDFTGRATFKGRLYDCGEYPGAIADENGYDIHGSVYSLNQEAALKVLDDYEGFGDEQEQPNLFVRSTVNVKSSGQLVSCWIYLYNLNTDGLKEVTSGDYLSYLRS